MRISETSIMSKKSNKKHPKVQATSIIWGCAVGMLGICVPLVAITESGVILPLLVILGAGGGTVAVWFSPDKSQLEESEVKALEERIINLETIYTSLPDTMQPFRLPETEDH